MGGHSGRVARHQGRAKETVVVGTRNHGQLGAVIGASEGELRGRQVGGGTFFLRRKTNKKRPRREHSLPLSRSS